MSVGSWARAVPTTTNRSAAAFAATVSAAARIEHVCRHIGTPCSSSVRLGLSASRRGRRTGSQKLLEDVRRAGRPGVAAPEHVAEDLPGGAADALLRLVRKRTAAEVDDDALVDRDLRRCDLAGRVERQRDAALGVRDVSARLAEALHDRRAQDYATRIV